MSLTRDQLSRTLSNGLATAAGRAYRDESEAWLRDFVAHAYCPPYEVLIKAATGESIANDYDFDVSVSNDGKHLHFIGVHAHGSIPKRFWDSLEVVTGTKITNRPEFFSSDC